MELVNLGIAFILIILGLLGIVFLAYIYLLSIAPIKSKNEQLLSLAINILPFSILVFISLNTEADSYVRILAVVFGLYGLTVTIKKIYSIIGVIKNS